MSRSPSALPKEIGNTEAFLSWNGLNILTSVADEELALDVELLGRDVEYAGIDLVDIGKEIVGDEEFNGERAGVILVNP
jgi:hypothetical protein